MWWGGWLLFNYPDQFDFDDFLISNFALLFSLFGLGAAFQDMSDRKETEKSASRIFYLLDRKSEIDPLSSDGKILNTTTTKKKKRKSSVKRKKSSKALIKVTEDNIEDTEEMKKPSSGKASKKKSTKKLDTDAPLDSPQSPKKRKSSVKKKKSEKKKKSKEGDDADAAEGDE